MCFCHRWASTLHCQPLNSRGQVTCFTACYEWRLVQEYKSIKLMISSNWTPNPSSMAKSCTLWKSARKMTWTRLLYSDNQKRYVKTRQPAFSTANNSLLWWKPIWAVTVDSLHQGTFACTSLGQTKETKVGKMIKVPGCGDGQRRAMYPVTGRICTRDGRLRRIWPENGFSSEKRAVYK